MNTSRSTLVAFPLVGLTIRIDPKLVGDRTLAEMVLAFWVENVLVQKWRKHLACAIPVAECDSRRCWGLNGYPCHRFYLQTLLMKTYESIASVTVTKHIFPHIHAMTARNISHCAYVFGFILT
jgi:hypothetical protein